MRMIRHTIIAMLIAAAALPSLGGAASAQVMTRSVRKPFELTAAQTIDSEGNVLLAVTTAIDYRRLVFFREPNGYVAEYRVYIEIRDDDGHNVKGDVIEKRVVTEEYDQTRSAAMMSQATWKVPLGAGEYKIDVTIEVVKTDLRYQSDAQVKIYGRDQGLFEMSDPIFSTPSDPRAERKPPPGELEFIPCEREIPEGFRQLAGGVFIGFEGWIHMSWTVLTPTENRSGRDMDLTVRVEDTQNRIWGYTRRTFEVDGEGRGMFCVEMNIDDLPLGFYRVSAAVSIPNSTKKVIRTGDFTMLLGRAMFDDYFEDTLKLLSYTADDDEIKRLREISPDERIAEWNRYWKERDPTRTTDLNEELSEFLRRVRFTLENFSSHGPGWSSDMGRIYIRHGPPDNTSDRDGTTLGTRWKIWYYYSKGLAFIFEDTTGSGLYRLVDTRSI